VIKGGASTVKPYDVVTLPPEVDSFRLRVAVPWVVGEVVTVKVIEVALTYDRTPARPVPPVTDAKVVVGLKPVPVKVTVVPYFVPTAIAAGVEDVTAGPATENAVANGVLVPPELVFSTVTATAPAAAPLATATGAVMEVPVLAVGALKVTNPPELGAPSAE
jgi:hypothetical protein